MKKITLLISLLIASFGFSQSLPIDFSDPLDNGFVGVSGSVFSADVSPTDGANAVGKIVGGTDQWNSRINLALDTYIDMTTASKTFTFEFYTTEAVPMQGLFQIGNEENGGFPIEMQFTTDGSIGWQTITLDFIGSDNGYPNCQTCPDPQPLVYGQYAQVSVFTNFGDNGTSTYYVDDIAGAANGAAVPAPLTSFSYDFTTPTPFTTYNATFDDDAVNIVTDGINPTTEVGELSGVNDDWWSQLKYDVPFGVDLSTGNKGFSIKVKGPRALPVTIKVEGSQEHAVTVDYTTPNIWEELLFNFNSYTTTTNTKIALFFDIQVNGDVVTDPLLNIFQFDDFVFDVILFEPDPEPASAAPTPQHTTVASIYSDEYTDPAVINYNPGWSQSTIWSEVQYEGNNTMRYDNLNYQGIDFGSNPIDASGMDYLHFDYWTLDGTQFRANVITGATGEKAFIINPATQLEWVSVDVPVSYFTGLGLDLSVVNQFKFDTETFDGDGQGGAPNASQGFSNARFYVDNIYFYQGMPMSTSNLELSELKVYPNPSQDVWNIKTNSIIINAVQVYDILGNQVISMNPSSSQAVIDASRLSSGVYIAKIGTEHGNATFRLIRK